MSRFITLAELIDGFQRVGLKPGNVVLVHSAMRTVGRIEAGADTVVDALLEVIGPGGTLVAPTFTFAHEAEKNPIIDPALDRSEMGAITEATRKRPQARRSVAYRHSFAAIGRHAEKFAQVDPALSAFDPGSAFGVMLDLDARILLLGVTYSSSTSHHFAELVCDVPYREIIPRQTRVRRPDGTLIDQAMIDYQPMSYTGARGPDFNRLGAMLEKRGLVGKTFIGNAAARLFPMRGLIDLAQAEAATDHNIFRTADGEAGKYTALDFGQCVLSPEFTDGAGRPNRVQWCVKDLSQLQMPG